LFLEKKGVVVEGGVASSAEAGRDDLGASLKVDAEGVNGLVTGGA